VFTWGPDVVQRCLLWGLIVTLSQFAQILNIVFIIIGTYGPTKYAYFTFVVMQGVVFI
jgi:hypothetical protein